MRTPNVNLDEIGSPGYRRAFDFFDDDELGNVACDTARDMLRHRSGSVMEDFAVISAGSKTVVTKMTSSSEPKMAALSRENIRVIDKTRRSHIRA